MKRAEVKKLLKEAYKKRGVNIAESTLISLTNGTRRPRYEIMVDLSDKIPFTAWQNIKSYFQDNRKRIDGE